MKIKIEYIWIDGTEPTKCLRSKTRILGMDISNLLDIPYWSFDGSSTNQAEGNNSDLLLVPVKYYGNPIDTGVVALCEVHHLNGDAHQTNTRNLCCKAYDKVKQYKPLFGLEQEYFIFDKKESIAANHLGLVPPEGRYFCGVGGNVSFGREIAQQHLDICLQAGLSIEGINAEVAPGQWEFQIGVINPIDLGDEIWVARWFLDRIAEQHNYWINYSAKPYTNWNGSGAHLNFSFQELRDNEVHYSGFCEILSTRLDEHLQNYGYDYQKRLTGKHETCSYKEFKYGLADRTASIRISNSQTYIEDRRPNANTDPYLCTKSMLDSLYIFYNQTENQDEQTK